MIDAGSGEPLPVGECLEDESDEGGEDCWPNNAGPSHNTIHAMTIPNRRMKWMLQDCSMIQVARFETSDLQQRRWITPAFNSMPTAR